MKLCGKLFLLCVATFSAGTVNSQVRDNDEILAARGEGVLTHDVFEARISRIPEEKRFAFVRDRSRIENDLDQLLLILQLAQDARDAGFDKDPGITARMELAGVEELARAWMDNFLANVEPADYTAMAREEYLVNSEKYMTAETVDVSHILIKPEQRTPEEALILAQELQAQIIADPSVFDALVTQYSEDSSKANNKGSFKDVKRGDMVPEFETVSFDLEPGEISEPVLSQYGYHIIRKDGATPAQQIPFEDVQTRLEMAMAEDHVERQRRIYLNELYESEFEVTRESIERTVENLFGREVLAKYADESETE